MIGIKLDLSDFEKLLNIDKAVEEVFAEGSKEFAKSVEKHAKELAEKKLKTRRQMFLDALSMKTEKTKEGLIHYIELDGKAKWIEEGQDEHNMIEALLKSPHAKTSKEGKKYVVVPFKHNTKGAPSNDSFQGDLRSTIKSAFRQAGIPFNKIETGADGNPLLGKLHSLSVLPQPGHEKAVGKSGTPILAGVKVYQTMNDKGKVSRSVMTFRVASESQEGKGIWDHPGNEPANILKETYDWAQQELDKITPELLKQILTKIS